MKENRLFLVEEVLLFVGVKTSFGQKAAALFHEQNTQLIYKKNYRYFETTVQILNLKYNMPIS